MNEDNNRRSGIGEAICEVLSFIGELVGAIFEALAALLEGLSGL